MTTSGIPTDPVRRGLLALIALCTLASCDTAVVQNPNDVYLRDFDQLWVNFDRVYPYFEYKQVDWDSMFTEYRPRAEKVRDHDALLELFIEMLAPLRDVHVMFQKPGGIFIPTWLPDKPVNWNEEVWDAIMTENNWTEIRSHWGFATISEVPYVVIPSWGQGVTVSPSEFGGVIQDFVASPGLIIDVRMNGGGNDWGAYLTAGRFTPERYISEYTQVRNGPEHGDLSELEAKEVYPFEGQAHFDRPVALLVGRGCFSSNESFISAMRERPNVTVIGDTTGGGSGKPDVFQLSNGWQYSISTWIAYTADKEVVEWNGIAPDIHVPFRESDFVGTTDPVLEFAIDWVKSQDP